MQAITYRATKAPQPGFNFLPDRAVHDRGVAYETDEHFVHLDQIVATGPFQTVFLVTEGKSGALANWVETKFGATEIEPVTTEVGHTVSGVWRPGLTTRKQIYQGLDISDVEERLAAQALLLLIQRLDEIFLYIEPAVNTLESYGHKTRELLILACTEVENIWKSYMRLAGEKPPNKKNYTTNDYVRLAGPLFLDEYEISLHRYPSVPTVCPFLGWDQKSPTQSITWFDAYNKTKHDRSTQFPEASLENCIRAVSAAIVLHAVRFGPSSLFNLTLINEGGALAALCTEVFSLRLPDRKPSTYYVPFISLPQDHPEDLQFIYDGKRFQPYTPTPLCL